MIELLILHNVSGHEVTVNPAMVTSLQPRQRGELFAEGVECMINLADGKFVTVREACEDVRRLIAESRK